MYTSLFTLVYLQYALLAGDNITTYADSYCKYLTTGIADKISMINTLASYDPSNSNFSEMCYTELTTTTNYWFDPVIPSEFILVGDMCQAYNDLFLELSNRNITIFDDQVIYAYTLVYQMYLNAQEEQIFEKCVDSKMLSDTVNYCETTIVGSLNLTLWTTSNEDTACGDAAVIIEDDCNDTSIIN